MQDKGLNMQIKQLSDIYGEDYDTQRIYEEWEVILPSIIQEMHKENGGTRKLKDSSIELRIMILGAFNQVEWEAIGVRGLYYRVVSIYGLPKTEATYKKVQAETLAMRRDGTLGYKYVVDGSRHTYGSTTYDDPHEFLTNVSWAYKRDIWADSQYQLEVTVEKGAMKDILMPTCREYGVDLSPTSGFNSETAWYSLAERYKRAEDNGKLPVLLMLTDYDTAGLQMFNSAKEAMERFGVQALIKHIGLLPQHIAKYNLVTRTDKIDADMEACELDAMTPIQARELLEESILKFADIAQFNAVREQEDRERVTLLEMAKGLREA